MRRLLLALAGLTVLGLGGCPPALEDPERFPAECLSGASAEVILAQRCGGASCHGPGNADQIVDLVSEGVAERLRDKPATKCEKDPLEGVTLIDPRGAAESWLYVKIAETPACGASMPGNGRRLCASEIDAIRQWLDAQATAADAGAR